MEEVNKNGVRPTKKNSKQYTKIIYLRLPTPVDKEPVEKRTQNSGQT